MKFENLNQSNSTIVFSEGEEYRTTQNPYVNDEGTHYMAHAVDEKNDEYMIEWEIVHPDYNSLDDESETCDWENPVVLIIWLMP